MSRWIFGAVVLFGLWAVWERVWIGWLLPGWAELPVFALTLLLPTAVIGALVDRWWAPSVVVSIFALPLVPSRCVTFQSFDAISGTCTGSSDELPWMVSFAFEALVAGTVIAAGRRRLFGRGARASAPARVAGDPAAG
jgi:hypothetical protein